MQQHSGPLHSATATIAVVVLLGLPTCFGFWGGHSVHSATKEPKKDNTLSLFHEGNDSLSWTNGPLHQARLAQSKDFAKSKEEYLGAPNLAQFFGIQEIDSIHMPLPLSIVLLGFQGDGNLGLNLTNAEIQSWLTHADHILPHARVDMAELSCAEDGQCTGLVSGRYSPTPLASHVHLNFTASVVAVKSRAVMAAFEHAIAAFSRPVDPSIETGSQQVDATKLEVFVDHFLASLGIGDTYTMLLLSPEWHVDEPVYGFRAGLSGFELDMLHDKAHTVLSMRPFGSEPQLPPPANAGTRAGAGGSTRHWYYGSAVTPKFQVHDLSWNSEAWVKVAEKYIQEELSYRRSVIKAAEAQGAGRAAAAVAHAARLLWRHHGKSGGHGSALTQVLRMELTNPDLAQEKLHSVFRTTHPVEDCLVNVWVGAGRWLLVDLTAGGKDWGPALGGDGVVTHQSLPHLEDYLAAAKSMKDGVKQDASMSPGSHSSAITREVTRLKQQRLPNIVNRRFHARNMRERHHPAPGSPPGGEDPHNDEEEATWRRSHQEALMQAELDVIEEVATKNCKDLADPPIACANLKEQALQLRQALLRLSATSGSAYDASRHHHNWDIFGSEPDFTKHLPELKDEESQAREALLAELAALVGRGVRHVITPPSAAWWARPGLPGGHISAAPFTKNVHFNVVLIKDGGKGAPTTAQLRADHPAHAAHARGHHADKSLESLASFNVQEFKDSVEQLKAYNQVFRWSTSEINLLDDPTLASGFAAATKTTRAQVHADLDMAQAEAERTYVDSAELAYHLAQRYSPHSLPKFHNEAPPTKEPTKIRLSERDEVTVNVYVFLINRDTSLLLDTHYSARAMPQQGMMLVISNGMRRDEQPTGMMCGGALLARPLSPMKEALAGMLTYLGGVLPPHLAYQPRRHAIVHDWLWSVGTHPQSFTSTGLRFSQIQRDALLRSHLMDSLDAGIEAMNAAVVRLAKTRPTELNYKHLLEHADVARHLLRKWGDILAMFRTCMSLAYSLDYATPLDFLHSLEVDVNFFTRVTNELLEKLEPRELVCKDKVWDPREWWARTSYIASAATVVLAMVYAAWPRLMGKKAKVN